jgi:hypothetical protein
LLAALAGLVLAALLAALTTLAALAALLLAGLVLAALTTLAALLPALWVVLLLLIALRILLFIRHWDVLRLTLGKAPAQCDNARALLWFQFPEQFVCATICNYSKNTYDAGGGAAPMVRSMYISRFCGATVDNVSAGPLVVARKHPYYEFGKNRKAADAWNTSSSSSSTASRSVRSTA